MIVAGFVGMDSGEVRRVAAALRSQSGHVGTIVGTVDGLVHQSLGHWHGSDAVDFAHVWTSSFRPRLLALRAWLDDMASSALVNADQQDRTSAVGGAVAGAGGVPGTAPGGGGGGRAWSQLGPRDLVEKLWRSELIGVGLDSAEVWKGWKLDKFPTGMFWGAALKGVGLGSSLVEFVDSFQHGDRSGAGASAVSAAATFVSAPISLLWTGLSSEAFFFIPENYSEQEDLLTWLRDERGLSPEEISDRYSGVQGFINLGNDNAARKAPWLVDGADRLLEKPAEWLYDVGIKL